MIKKRFLISLLVAATPAAAQENPFAPGSKATSWNLFGEKPALFEAKVVDLTCEITGDCPEDCGGGKRQLGLLRSADGVLVYPNKNNQPLFSGAATEFLPFCGQTVEVDGLLVEDEDIGARHIFLVQMIRPEGRQDWVKADQWTKVWAENNPDAAGDGPWFRRDPRVNNLIAKDGYFGLGLEEDATIKKELWP